MTDRYEFLYVESSIADGETLREWRVAHGTPRRSLWARFNAWWHHR